MKKTISTIIKASLVTVGVMGVVTLNAWWCNHCNRNHRGRVCPATGNSQYGCGPAYGCWEQEIDSDDEEAFMQDMMRRRQARAQKRGGVSPLSKTWLRQLLPLVEHMPNGTPIYGPSNPSFGYGQHYLTPENKAFKKVAGEWLRCTSIPDIFINKAGEVLDGNGNRVQPVGALADGYRVYKHPHPGHSVDYFAYVAGEEEGSIYSDGGYVLYYAKTEYVEFIYNRFVYSNYNGYQDGGMRLAGPLDILFDGRQWIDKRTGKIFNSPEEM